ncbi:hypothetical protein A3I25_01955 [Candidatus Nomurabacteria bacterium RIFCSPLOWO2_02_FULL_42_17]|uniref:Uncharacterized protein n=2 Tax=Candidatus Nomuraibacteriota TaxID=1752729 RepID=A0A1F6WK29_9BACT|nr:MAG: hypothetical protein A3B93_01465 [Candidatus Nomurabacteria bacterium RIFCSPHIGHO2_02_FULL_42_24]OGI97572.1 MAG: hypothetical protein A3I25_01955 [Candidatus Nomurabacteria bacterium RIFCSPLOWO2_02_FULL_42_17]
MQKTPLIVLGLILILLIWFGVTLKSDKVQEHSARIYIMNESGEVSGFSGDGFKQEIPNVIIDENGYGVDILFPQGTYRYFFRGIQNGVYDVYLKGFSGLGIPIKLNEVHEYIFAEDKSPDENWVTILIDKEGDGANEYAVTSTSTINGKEFKKQQKK